MKCPVCSKFLTLDDRFCAGCGAFVKGKRKLPDGTSPEMVDLNHDSIEIISRVPGLTYNNAVFIVRERTGRGGFINVTEVGNLIGLTHEETLKLDKIVSCEPVKKHAQEPMPQTPGEIPAEWEGFVSRLDHKNKENPQEIVKETQPEAQAAAVKVDLNNADEGKIAALPGIGVVLTKRIIEERSVRGGFASLNDIAGVLGLKPYAVKRLEPLVIFNEPKKKVQTKKGRVVDY